MRTNFQFAARGSAGLKSVLITSSSPEEGKTTIAEGRKVAMTNLYLLSKEHQ